jgi:hypothetical protein
MSTSPPCGSREGRPKRAPRVPGWSVPADARRGSSAVDGRLALVAVSRSCSVPFDDCIVPPHGTSPAHKKTGVGKKGPRVARGILGGGGGGRFRMNPRWRRTWVALVLVSGDHPRSLLRGAARRAADRIGMDRDITRHWSHQRRPPLDGLGRFQLNPCQTTTRLFTFVKLFNKPAKAVPVNPLFGVRQRKAAYLYTSSTSAVTHAMHSS